MQHATNNSIAFKDLVMYAPIAFKIGDEDFRLM